MKGRGHNMPTEQGRQAQKIVDEIVRDLSNRRGLSQEWGQLDDEAKSAIKKEWRRATVNVLNADKIKATP